MSVRSNGSGDNLARNTALVSTGDFSIGIWCKWMSDLDGYVDIVGLADENANPSVYLDAGTGSSGTAATMFGSSGWGTLSSTYEITLETWYYIVISRSGTTPRLRVFADTTSTTPLHDATMDGNVADLSSYDWLVISQMFTGEWIDAEFTCCRVVTGDAWSDAECRAESQSYTEVTGAGTLKANWKLKDVDSDSDGINDSSGNGYHLTNTGFVAGASSPTQLSEGGGGSVVPIMMAHNH